MPDHKKGSILGSLVTKMVPVRPISFWHLLFTSINECVLHLRACEIRNVARRNRKNMDGFSISETWQVYKHTHMHRHTYTQTHSHTCTRTCYRTSTETRNHAHRLATAILSLSPYFQSFWTAASKALLNTEDKFPPCVLLFVYHVFFTYSLWICDFCESPPKLLGGSS